MFSRVTVLGILASILSVNLPVQAETCTPLPLVGGQGSQVSKTVSQPNIPGPYGIKLARNNWNTDWAVPGGQQFAHFVATIVSANGGTFDIKMYLKYSDQTTGEFYNTDGVQLNPGNPLKIDATSRPDDIPYQVNLFIGGLEHIGDAYTASVVGCR